MTLKEKLADWKQWEGAAFELGVVLGLWEGGPESWFKNKGVLWSANPISKTLGNFLQELVTIGVLEHRDEPDTEFRWKPAQTIVTKELGQ